MIHGLIPKLSEGGKIKIGGLGDVRQSKSGGDYRLPVKHDYFTITKTFRNKQGDLVIDKGIMALLNTDPETGEYEAKPIKELPIVLHSDDIEDVFPTNYAMYASKKIACRGDGKKATRHEIKSGKKTGRTKEIDCPCDQLNKTCKPHGILHCSLRVPGAAVAGSVYKWRTTSLISIEQMIGSLTQIKQVTYGVLQGLPLWLVLREVEVTPEDAPTSKVYVCHIELRGADLNDAQNQVLQLMQTRNAFAREIEENRKAYHNLLTAPAAEDESEDEQAETSAEFHPAKNNSQAVDAMPLDPGPATEEEEPGSDG